MYRYYCTPLTAAGELTVEGRKWPGKKTFGTGNEWQEVMYGSIVGLAQTWPRVGLTHGLGRVRSNMNYCQTALVNIISNHEYKTVEAMELIRWAVRGSLLNMDD